ncbi:MAG: cadmium-translocating P-type ATPase [Alphaproteobacteria bacterium]|nr:MAG: cadmium-translocating P-type ATPase [Alphaproteobacteria bacterium]
METAVTDYTGLVGMREDGKRRLQLAVEGISCAGCAMKIERELNARDGVEARVNMTRRHLTLVWSGDDARGNRLIRDVEQLGFRLSPVAEKEDDSQEEKFLLRCMAIAGFASGNIMVFSLALWFTSRDTMGAATQDLFHWICALIALPAIVYSGRPFFYSAWKALRHFRTNMDVPISVGVILATSMSLYETAAHGAYVYFDAAVMLLFLLLAGRYLDRQSRGQAREAARNILALNSGTATILDGGRPHRIPAENIRPGMTLIVAEGERIFADGRVAAGEVSVDASALTGETLPRRLAAGDAALAGMVNLGGALQVSVSKSPADSLAGEIVRLMEKAEQSNARYVRIADRISRYYTPVVHLLALGAFLFWWAGMGLAWQPALMIAVTVLIITCPCALGLAVPVVQVLASQWLFRRGMLVKTADALERLAMTDTVIFDKTGTLTTGAAEADLQGVGGEMAQLAASLAVHSRHPLCLAISRQWPGALLPLENVREAKGEGISASYKGDVIRLGSRPFCGVRQAPDDDRQETWIARGGAAPQRITFLDQLRPDAARTVADLKRQGLRVLMLSGDRRAVAETVAGILGIAECHAEVNPKQKLEIIDGLHREGRRVLMVGDGINDAPALLRAGCSMSPSTAMEVTQNAADVVFQGASLKSVSLALRAAAFCRILVRQNFAMALLYNVVALPLAMTGHVTPLIAAIAMSASSLAVTFNALRFNRLKED